MSDKLLHEKMRELAETRMCPELSSITLNNGKKVTRLTSEELTGLADEIERYYIPRPRFEDGEPVQFGIHSCGGMEKTATMARTL